jgi:SlyX protein
MEEKLIELETKFSYQEDLLSDLNDIVAKQQLQLDELITEMSGIKEQLQDAAERGSAEGHKEQDEKPPHY